MEKTVLELLKKCRKDLDFWNSPLVKEIDSFLNKNESKVKKQVCQCKEDFNVNEVSRNPLVYKCTKCGETVL